jgi:hypothetical protein
MQSVNWKRLHTIHLRGWTLFNVEARFHEAFCDISHRLGGITPFGVFSDAFPGLKMWDTFACATAICLPILKSQLQCSRTCPLTHGYRKEPGLFMQMIINATTIHCADWLLNGQASKCAANQTRFKCHRRWLLLKCQNATTPRSSTDWLMKDSFILQSGGTKLVPQMLA